MAELYVPEGFFVTTLSSDINASTATIPLTAVPSTVTKGYMVIEPNHATKREVIHFTSVGASTVTAADDTTDGTDATGRGCKGSITAGANTSHDQGVTVIIAASYNYWKRLMDKLNGSDATVLVDSSGNEILKTASVASAVNELTLKNAATGNGPEVQATGGDTNIDLNLAPKGTGAVNIKATADSSSEIRVFEDTDNGANYIGLKSPSTLSASKTFILPTGDGSASQVLKTDGSGNLGWATPSAVSNDGWTTDAGATWTYLSATTITTADGTLFQKGDRIKLTQTTAKYFIVTGVSGNVITVTGGTDYTVANAAITTQQYSHQANPLGFPTSFAYTATWTCSGSMTISVGTVNFTRFSVVGNKCAWTFSYTAFTLGGTQSTDIYATLPISSSRTASNTANDAVAVQIVNGGASSVGYLGIKDSDATKALFRVNNSGSTNWTLGTTNGFLWGQLVYEI